MANPLAKSPVCADGGVIDDLIVHGAQNLEAAFLSSTQALPVDLHIFVSTSIGNTLDVVTAVRDFSTDLGFIEWPCHAADVIVEPWLEAELVIVAAPSHPLLPPLCPG